MIALVTGGRDFSDRERLYAFLYKLNPDCVVQGGARGADELARRWCRHCGKPCITMDANWDYYLKTAGPIRNSWMLSFVAVDVVVACPGGRGTADMVNKAWRAKIEVRYVK